MLGGRLCSPRKRKSDPRTIDTHVLVGVSLATVLGTARESLFT